MRLAFHQFIHGGVLAICAGLFAGCAVLNPAPVSERTPPPKPGAKPAPVTVQPDAAPKPDAGVIATPLPPAATSGSAGSSWSAVPT